MKQRAGDRFWAAGLLLPVVLAGVFSLSRIAAETDDVPRDEDYVAAREVIEGWGFRAGEDALSVLPPWSLRPHKVLKRFQPISGDALASRPLERWARLFVLVEPDAERYLEPLEERLGAPAAVEQRGRVSVLRFDLGGRRVLFDFARELAKAEIVVRDADQPDDPDATRCDRPTRNGLACRGAKNWQRVTREHLLVSENGQHVVWAHPPARGQVLEMTWRNVPLSDVLVFRGGHTRSGADVARASVDVEVLVGGEPLAELRYPPRFSFDAARLDTTRFAGQRRDVTFRVSTEDNGKNHWAFDAFSARGGGR